MEGTVDEHTAAATGVDDLVQRLREIVAAVDTARALGAHAEVPHALREACAAVIARDTSPGGGGWRAVPAALTGSGAETPRTGRGVALDSPAGGLTDAEMAQQVPLRRLIWQVISPGEEFTVAQIVDRLAELGAQWPANKVSNALGYWVNRNRLDRPRKGRYLYPVDAPPPVAELGDGPEPARQMLGGVADRAPAVRGKEVSSYAEQTGRRAVAM